MGATINGIDIEALFNQVLRNEINIREVCYRLEFIQKNNPELKVPTKEEHHAFMEALAREYKQKFPRITWSVTV